MKAAGLPNPEMFFRQPQPGVPLAPPQGPSPEQMKAEFQMQLEQVKADAARDKEEAQAAADMAVKRLEAEIKAVEMQAQSQLEAEREDRRLTFDMMVHADRMKLERAKLSVSAGRRVRRSILRRRGDALASRDADAHEAAKMDSLSQTQALLSAPRRKTAVGPNGKTYTITEALDMGEPQAMVN